MPQGPEKCLCHNHVLGGCDFDIGVGAWCDMYRQSQRLNNGYVICDGQSVAMHMLKPLPKQFWPDDLQDSILLLSNELRVSISLHAPRA